MELSSKLEDQALDDKLRKKCNHEYFSAQVGKIPDRQALAALLIVANSRPSSPILLDRVRRLLAWEARVYLRALSLPQRTAPQGGPSESVLHESIPLFASSETAVEEPPTDTRFDAGAPGDAFEHGGSGGSELFFDQLKSELKENSRLKKEVEQMKEQATLLPELQASAFEETERADEAEEELAKVKKEVEALRKAQEKPQQKSEAELLELDGLKEERDKLKERVAELEKSKAEVTPPLPSSSSTSFVVQHLTKQVQNLSLQLKEKNDEMVKLMLEMGGK
ncbi:hypothetical protein JCM10213_005413 [Rhodosporidiobolus nylandii]